MKYNLLIGLFTAITFTHLPAQKQWANYWPIDFNIALDFSSGQPQINTQCVLRGFEASGSICDDNGNLLFYSNGGGRDPLQFSPPGSIWNRKHKVMYDMGNTEGGGYSAKQGAVIIPAPGKPGQYYLFTMEEGEYDVNGGGVPGQPLGRGLSYFLVDMSLNAGLGGVVHYEPSILVPSYEGMCLIRHPNCVDYWVVVCEYGTDKPVVFPVTADGVGTGKKYNLHPTGGHLGLAGSEIKSSPDGKWLRLANYIVKFNGFTGQLSDPLKIAVEDNFFEFSPNSRYVYGLSSLKVFRYDLLSPNPAQTQTAISTFPVINQDYPELGPLQLAPDGNIYFLTNYDQPFESCYLNAIKDPDIGGNVAYKVLELPYQPYYPALPDFPAQWFSSVPNRPEFELGSTRFICPGDTLHLNTGITGFPVSWNTLDSTHDIIIHAPGTYTATVRGCESQSDTIIVERVSCGCEIILPNAFTPDGNNSNDIFRPIELAGDYTLYIFDRWGQKIFESTGNTLTGWDGTTKGRPVPPDVYFYQITSASCKKTVSGAVTLIR